MPMVYDELRTLGRRCLAGRGQGVLQPTVLVHEAWLKLAGKHEVALTSRLHFYALSAKIIRGMLVDHYRKERSRKRGGSRIATRLDGAEASGHEAHADLLALDQAVTRLAEIKPRYAQLIELKFFGGLTIAECAESLAVSHATVEREWNFALAWLRRELKARD